VKLAEMLEAINFEQPLPALWNEFEALGANLLWVR